MMRKTFKPAASTQKRISNRAVKKEKTSLSSTRTQQAQDLVKERLMLHQPVSDQRFPTGLMFSMMKHLMDEKIATMEHSPACSAVTPEQSESVNEVAKSLSSGRYKLICYVAIGQLRNAAVSCSSCGIWSQDTDSFTEYLFKNQHLFALRTKSRQP